MSVAPLDRFRKPEYTGENRCLPCTAVNVGIALALAAGASFVGTPAVGVAVFALSLASIWLRGYLVPGTPELTKRYLPDRALAWFDKAPADGSSPTAESTPDLADGETVDHEATELQDPEAVLVEAGAVRETEDGSDIELTEAFAADLLAAARDLRGDDEDAADARVGELASLFAVDPETAVVNEEVFGPGFYADSERIHNWPSDGALLADASAQRVLGGRDVWTRVHPQQRLGICKALRSFLETCPVCEGEVSLTEDTVESCCRSWKVFAVRCADCDTHFLEIDPADFGESTEAAVRDTGGVESVSGGFTRG